MERGEEQAKQNGHGDGDAAEWKKVAELRAVVEAQDPAVKVHIDDPSASVQPLLLSPQLLA
jgi:hypothetical protein